MSDQKHPFVLGETVKECAAERLRHRFQTPAQEHGYRIGVDWAAGPGEQKAAVNKISYEESRIHWTEVADPDDWTPIGKPAPEYLGELVKDGRPVS